MAVTFYGMAGPQSTMFGISHANIVPKLNRRNWKTKAGCRVRPDGPIYITIQRGEKTSEGEKREVHYRVEGVFVDVAVIYEQNFPTLPEALAFANGEDAGEISQETRPPEGPHEYPLQTGGEVVISGMSRTDQGLVPNFSVQFREEFSEEE